MLNPLAEIAQQGELVSLVYVHEPSVFNDVSSCVAAVQSAINSDTDIIPGGNAQGFAGQSGAVYVGISIRVPRQSNGKVYDTLLKPVSLLPVTLEDHAFGSGMVLAFVDYGNGINDAIGLAQTVANADDGTNATFSVPYLAAFDSIGPLTPYAIGTGNTSAASTGALSGQQNTTQKVAMVSGAAAAGLENLGKKIQSLSTATTWTILGAVVGLILLDRLILKED